MARLPVIGHGGANPPSTRGNSEGRRRNQGNQGTALLSVWLCNCCTLLYIPSQFGAKTSSSRSSLVCPCVPKPSERKEMAVDLLILDLLIDWSSKKGPNFHTGENSCMFRTSHRNFQDQWRWRVRISGIFKLYWAFIFAAYSGLKYYCKDPIMNQFIFHVMSCQGFVFCCNCSIDLPLFEVQDGFQCPWLNLWDNSCILTDPWNGLDPLVR